MTETPATYHLTSTLDRRHTAILRILTPLGWQAQRMAMETRDVRPAQAAEAALAQLDDLQEAIERARRLIIEEAGT